MPNNVTIFCRILKRLRPESRWLFHDTVNLCVFWNCFPFQIFLDHVQPFNREALASREMSLFVQRHLSPTSQEYRSQDEPLASPTGAVRCQRPWVGRGWWPDRGRQPLRRSTGRPRSLGGRWPPTTANDLVPLAGWALGGAGRSRVGTSGWSACKRTDQCRCHTLVCT